MIFIWRNLHDISEDARASRHEEEPDEEDIDVSLYQVLGIGRDDNDDGVDRTVEHHSFLSSDNVGPVSE